MVIQMSDIRPTRPITTFGGRLSRGYNLLGGTEGGGKSTLTMLLAAHFSSGKILPHTRSDEEVPSGQVLIINREDHLSSSSYPRLTAVDCKMENISFGSRDVRSPEKLKDELEDWLAVSPDPVLIVIDPVSNIFTNNGNESGITAKGVYQITKMIEEVLDPFNLYILIVQHTNKGHGQSKLDGFQYGIWTKTARDVLRFEDATYDDTPCKALWHVKSNVSALGIDLPMRIVEDSIPDEDGVSISVTKLEFMVTDGREIEGLPYKPFNSLETNSSSTNAKKVTKGDTHKQKILDAILDGKALDTHSAFSRTKLTDDMAKKLGLNTRSVRRYIAELVEAGAIVDYTMDKTHYLYIQGDAKNE